jgi:hypothetical protein
LLMRKEPDEGERVADVAVVVAAGVGAGELEATAGESGIGGGGC